MKYQIMGGLDIISLIIGIYLIGSVIGIKLSIGIGFIVWSLLPWK